VPPTTDFALILPSEEIAAVEGVFKDENIAPASTLKFAICLILMTRRI